MQRNYSLFLGGIALLIVVAILSLNRGTTGALKLSSSEGIPTSGILGATAIPTESMKNTPTITAFPTISITVTTTPTPTKTVEPTPSLRTPSPTQTPMVPTCSAYTSKLKIRATEFMNTHKAKDAYDVLALISDPYDSEEQEELDFWLGTGDENAGGLYQTASTSYTTTKFTIGTLSDRGDDPRERGNRLCQMTISEEREKKEPDQTTTTDSYARYIDFSLSPDGTFTLTGFKSSKDGSKYSGFN